MKIRRFGFAILPVITQLDFKKQKTGIVFLLWGKFAQTKKALIDTEKHFVFESAHPSPLAGNAFQGCGHFVKTNEVLEGQGKLKIDWQV